jgi:hypothetical protein
LVPVRGRTPPNLDKLLGDLKAAKPWIDPTRPDPAPPTPDNPSGIPAQYSPRQSRTNVAQREVTALNLYVAYDPSYDDYETDQWGPSGYDTTDDLTDDDTDFGYSDRFIHSFRTVRLSTIRILYMHRHTDIVSVVDGGTDTMVLCTGW